MANGKINDPKLTETRSEEVLPAETSEGEELPFVPSGKYRLNDQQKRAAQLVVQNFMAPIKGRKNYQEISEELGIHRHTLQAWRSLPEFHRYKNDMIGLFINDSQTEAYFRLMELVRGDQSGTPSIRAIQTVFEMSGRLKNKHEVEMTYNPGTQEDLSQVSGEELNDIIATYSEEDEDEKGADE